MSGSSHGTPPLVRALEKISVAASNQQLSRSDEDPEKRSQARKRKKWKQNLSVNFTEEQELSSDSDAEIKAICTFETNEAIALRFPYPMFSDDSDNDEDLNYYPRLTENNNHVNKKRKKILSGDENTEFSEENKSYKHKKRKLNHGKNSKTTEINNVRDAKEVQSVKCKNSALITDNNTRSKKIASKKNANLPNKGFKNKSLQIELPNPRQKSPKNEKNSTFLDSSSEEEVVEKLSRRHTRFKRIHLISSSSSDSDSKESKSIIKKERTRILSTSPSSSDDGKETLIDNEKNEHQTHTPAKDTTQIKYGLKKTNKVHSISLSSSSEDNNEHHFVPQKNILRYKIHKKTPPLCLSNQQSSKLPVSQNNKEADNNINYIKLGKESKTNLNTHVWKNIANVQIKQSSPKVSSKQQSYLQTLKRWSNSSTKMPVESHRKIIDKTPVKGEVTLIKDSCSKSNMTQEDSIPGERQSDHYQELLDDTSKSGNSNNEKQPLDLNINMNVQIICSPSLVENTNSEDNSVSKYPAENKHKVVPPALDVNLSLSHQGDKTRNVSSSKNLKLFSTVEKRYSESNLKCGDTNKFKDKTQLNLKQNNNKRKLSGSNEDMLKNEKKGPKTQLGEKLFTENNERSGNDLLSNILYEMDNNPYKVEKVLPRKALESPAEKFISGSLTPGLHSTPSPVYFPVNSQSSEKENKLLSYKSLMENQVGLYKQAVDDVGLPDKSSPTPVIPSSIESLHNLNKNLEESKMYKNTCVREPINSEKHTNQKLVIPTVITSFYSVNSEDYIQPHENPNYNTESICTWTQNTANIVNRPQIQTLDKNSTSSICKELMKENQSMNLKSKSRTTKLDQPSSSVSNQKSINQDPSSSQKTLKKSISQDPSSRQKALNKNQAETGDTNFLRNKASAERDLKEKDNVQSCINELVKIQKQNIPSSQKTLKKSSQDPTSSQQTLNENQAETGDAHYLGNKASSEVCLKYTNNLQYTINELLKLRTKNKPPEIEKVSICEEVKMISFPKSSNNSNLGHTTLKPSLESTTSLENSTINHCVASNKEVIKSPKNENSNLISNIKPSKGIRIRLNGNVYRLHGKENVIDSNAKVKIPKENILGPITENKNENAMNILLNKNSNNSTGCTESKGDKSSSSSEDSSDESSSSEDNLIVSEKSCSGKSSSESSSSEDEGVPNRTVTNNTSTEDEKNKNGNKEVESEMPNLNVARPISRVLKVTKPPKSYSFTLGELLGFHENNKIKSSLQPKSSCNVVTDDVIMLSSSSESESNEIINSVYKATSVEKINDSVLKNIIENNCTKPKDFVVKNQNSIENNVCKIRVKSLVELGISNAYPLPDNALKAAEAPAVESTEHSLEAHQLPNNAVDCLNSTNLGNNDSVVKKKSGALPSQPKGKRSSFNSKSKTVRHNLQAPPSLQNELNITGSETNVEQLKSSVTSIHVPKINIIPGDKINKHCPCKRSSNKSTKKCVLKQPEFSKQNTCSQLPCASNISAKSIAPKSTSNHFLLMLVNTSNQPHPKTVQVINQTQLEPLKTGKECEIPTALTPVIPKSGDVACLRVPDVNNSVAHNSTVATPSLSGTQQNINQTEQQTNVEVSVDKMASCFFKLCDELFCEVVMNKVPKLVDDLHLVITHDIMREERLKKVEQLKCLETKVEEVRRTEKEFNDMLKIRGQGFVPLFMTVVRKMEKESIKTQVIAFYCKIFHLLEQIDPINSTYRFKLKNLIEKMLMKSNIKITYEVYCVFSENITSFTANFNYIDNLLLQYDQFVIKRKQMADLSASVENNKDTTEQTIRETENSVEGIISENTTNQLRTTVITTAVKSPSSEQPANRTQVSSSNNPQAQLSSRSRVNPRPPVGNLDELLLGSFSEMSN